MSPGGAKEHMGYSAPAGLPNMATWTEPQDRPARIRTCASDYTQAAYDAAAGAVKVMTRVLMNPGGYLHMPFHIRDIFVLSFCLFIY